MLSDSLAHLGPLRTKKKWKMKGLCIAALDQQQTKSAVACVLTCSLVLTTSKGHVTVVPAAPASLQSVITGHDGVLVPLAS